MDVLNAMEERERGAHTHAREESESVLVGKVEHFYDRINVVAVTLSGTLKVGDIIEIGNREDAIRQRVESMQINGKNVDEAKEGESVGIKVKHQVPAGSEVHIVGRDGEEESADGELERI